MNTEVKRQGYNDLPSVKTDQVLVMKYQFLSQTVKETFKQTVAATAASATHTATHPYLTSGNQIISFGILRPK